MANGNSYGWQPPVPRKQTEAPLFRRLAPLYALAAVAMVVLALAVPLVFYRT